MDREALFAVLLWGVWPLWLAAGVTDWACHRRTGIERTSGLPEWMYHLVQAAQLGAALLIAMFLELDALGLALIGALVLWHWVTGYLDTRYTHARRDILPFEQSVHAVLELAPVFAAALLALAHPEAWRAPDWRWLPKAMPVPVGEATAFLAITLALLAGPLLEEGWRCRRQARALTSQAEPRISTPRGV